MSANSRKHACLIQNEGNYPSHRTTILQNCKSDAKQRAAKKPTVTDSDIESGNGRGGERRIERIPEMSLPKSLSVYWRNGVNVLWGDIQRASDIILARLGFEIS